MKELERHLRAGESELRTRCGRDIEAYRKGNFVLHLLADGKPVPDGARVTAELTDLDFRFGANVFMLEQYDDAEKNRAYEREFTALFNAAAIPLYWEGTEPREGYLRYGREVPNDVYRRPPADLARDFCLAHGLHMKGHPLFWHEFTPRWLDAYDWSEVRRRVQKRFEDVSARYAADVERFDVVNEPSRVWDVYMRDRAKGGYLLPDDGYLDWAFALAARLFPSNVKILNDTVGASFHEFRGKYSGFYLNLKDLLSRGAAIDEIGMQCHLGDRGGENVYNAERFYAVLDCYASLGKTINISEISIPSKIEGETDEDLQAEAAVQLYRAAFSHPAMTGVTWWNLPDDGILTSKRKAGDENLPSTGLLGGDYHEKKAYKALKKLIREEWTTREAGECAQGAYSFRGFRGTYRVTVETEGKKLTASVPLTGDSPRERIVRVE